MEQDVFTQEEINDLTECAIIDLGEKAGYMYVGWYLRHARQLINDWFEGVEYTDDDMEANHEEILQYMVKRYFDWFKGVKAEGN